MEEIEEKNDKFKNGTYSLKNAYILVLYYFQSKCLILFFIKASKKCSEPRFNNVFSTRL
jgi:hypothetical protein